jgi:hypothetical protein
MGTPNSYSALTMLIQWTKRITEVRKRIPISYRQACWYRKSCHINGMYVYVLSPECRKNQENIGTLWEIWKRDSVQRFWRGTNKSMSHTRSTAVWTQKTVATIRFVILYLLILFKRELNFCINLHTILTLYLLYLIFKLIFTNKLYYSRRRSGF